MNIEGYGAEEENIDKAAIRVAQTVEWVQGMRKGVALEVEELTASGWLGTAAGMFQGHMRNWDAEMKKVQDDLEFIAGAMGANAKTYAAVRGEVEQGMNMVDSLINTKSFEK